MPRAFFFKALFIFFYRILFRKIKSLRRNVSNVHTTTTTTTTGTTTINSQMLSFDFVTNNNFHKFHSLSNRSDDETSMIFFNVEGALLRSSCLFSYFILVSFEAGSLLRSIILFLSYPLLCLMSREAKLKTMVFISFFGLKKESFRAGSAVLPKFFLEDVGLEIFDALHNGSARKKSVALTNLPLVMVESFLRDYLQIDHVVGQEIKTFRGYYMGIMEETKNNNVASLQELSSDSSTTIGITDFRSLCTDHQMLSLCKDIYLVSRSEKATWHDLPLHRYPKPLIFHDGRLAMRPTPIATLQYYMWVPFAVILSLSRIAISLTLPYDIGIPILYFSGLRLTVSEKPDSKVQRVAHQKGKSKGGILYVCNHRTLLDPLYLCFSLKRNMTALTYSLSRMSEILAPIRTVRLTRNRAEDASKMDELLSQGDLVVCPEGTTCRESYLLRFSPLFSEISDKIVPLAVNTCVEMFHGTTAGGFKFLDPVFFLMNPMPSYMIQILDMVSTPCRQSDDSRFNVANRVQRDIGQALGFECTALTRRDKYLILAGNEGIVKNTNK